MNKSVEDIIAEVSARRGQLLSLSGRGLSEVPKQIWKMDHLLRLELNGNKLASLPPEITLLSNLIVLNLDSNQLTTLPPQIGSLAKLARLHLQDNQLRALPLGICQLSKLLRLELGHNEIESLPASIGQLTHLVWCSLEYNQLSTLPPEIGLLKNIRSLDLRNNRLSTLPQEIGQLTNLETILLQNNCLTELPQFEQLTKLHTLELNDNRLSDVPSRLFYLDRANTKLQLQNNRLLSLSRDVGLLKHLKSLNIENNELRALPNEIGELTVLEELNLKNNQISTLPPQVGLLKNLRSLNLANNRLRCLPPEIGELRNLESFFIQNNELTELPAEITQLTKLNKLQVVDDQLTPLPLTTRIKQWDIFVSYANEDKETVATPLVNILLRAGLKVWLDQHELKLGDSLREKIDQGLAKSRFGVVILSPNFLSKKWTKRELNGLMALEEDDHKVILPVWHQISHETLSQYSPILADRIAGNTEKGIPEVASRIIDVVLYRAADSPSTLFPSLTRRLVQFVENNHASKVGEFLVEHPVIIARAMGLTMSDRVRLQVHPFPIESAAMICVEVMQGSSGRGAKTYIVLESSRVPLFSTDNNPVESLASSIACLKGVSNPRTSDYRIRIEGGVVVAGRRYQLTESDKFRLGDYNDLLARDFVKIRTYDWLIDACTFAERAFRHEQGI